MDLWVCRYVYVGVWGMEGWLSSLPCRFLCSCYYFHMRLQWPHTQIVSWGNVYQPLFALELIFHCPICEPNRRVILLCLSLYWCPCFPPQQGWQLCSCLCLRVRVYVLVVNGGRNDRLLTFPAFNGAPLFYKLKCITALCHKITYILYSSSQLWGKQLLWIPCKFRYFCKCNHCKLWSCHSEFKFFFPHSSEKQPGTLLILLPTSCKLSSVGVWVFSNWGYFDFSFGSTRSTKNTVKLIILSFSL